MEYIERASQLADYEIAYFSKNGYKKIFDIDLDDTYFYDPKFWKLISKPGDTYDYIYDNLCLRSLTNESAQLALNEGFTDLEIFK